jgi:hypothetical protein
VGAKALMELWRGTEIIPPHASRGLLLMYFSNVHSAMDWFDENFDFHISWYQMNPDVWGGTGVDTNCIRRFIIRLIKKDFDNEAMEEHIKNLMQQ